jgi:hypothetical protein
VGLCQAEAAVEPEFAGPAAVAPVEPAAEQHAAGGAVADEQADDVVGELGGALPVLGERREVDVVLGEYPAGEGLAESAGEFEVRPLRHDHRRDAARLADDARHAHAQGPQLVRAHLLLVEEASDTGAEEGEAFRAAHLRVGLLAFAGDDVAREVGEQQHDLVQADVDTDDPSGLAAEAEAPGRAPGAHRRGLVVRLGEPPLRGQLLDDLVDGGAREPRGGGELAERLRTSRPLGAQEAQHGDGVQPPQSGQIMASHPVHLPTPAAHPGLPDRPDGLYGLID